MLKEFKEFALRGNVLDMAIGIIIGAAFGTVVSSLVNDLLMPPIGMLLGNVDFRALFIVLKDGNTPPPYGTIEEAKGVGAVTFNYGNFITNVITFLIVAFAVFLLVKGINTLNRKKEEVPPSAPATKECPFCKSTIAITASRCPHCTSELEMKR